MLRSGEEGLAQRRSSSDLPQGRTSFWDALCGFGYLLFVFVCEGSPEFLLMLLTE